MKKMFLLLIAIIFISININIMAQVPKSMSYQGILKDSIGNVVPNGQYLLTFRIYNQPVQGNLIWTEANNVVTQNGVFQVMLGLTNPINNFPTNAYLSIQVGNSPEMSPRKQVASVGYSLIANRSVVSDTANTLQGHPADDFVLESEYVMPFAISLPLTTVNVPNTDWNEIRNLTFNVTKPMIIRADGFFRRLTAGLPFRSQILLKNQQGVVIDYGEQSFLNPPTLIDYAGNSVFFNVNPGTYIISLMAAVSQAGTLKEVTIGVIALPQNSLNFQYTDFKNGKFVAPFINSPFKGE